MSLGSVFHFLPVRGNVDRIDILLGVIGRLCLPFSIMRLWSDSVSLVIATLCFLLLVSIKSFSNFTLVLNNLLVSAFGSLGIWSCHNLLNPSRIALRNLYLLTCLISSSFLRCVLKLVLGLIWDLQYSTLVPP